MTKREPKLPRSAAVREKCVAAYTLYNENVHVDVIGAALGLAQSTVYEYVHNGRALVALEQRHPGLSESVS